MLKKTGAPEVHAGSMADIAFLLLIFFLVTTTIETDVGLDRKLPPIETETPPPINERNIFLVSINKDNELLVEDNQTIALKDLKKMAIAHLDNGGALKEDPRYCDYCKGARLLDSSDNPTEAVISLRSDRGTSYGIYIAVQNELVGAYNYLRNREAQRRYKEDFTALEKMYLDPQIHKSEKAVLKEKVRTIQALFPLKLSEAEIETN